MAIQPNSPDRGRHIVKLSVQSVDKAFGDHEVLKGISCSIDAGEIATILGVSGCGKTTLLRIIAGLEVADAGDVSVDGRSIVSMSPQERNIGLVFQSSGIYEHLSVARNLELPLESKGMRSLESRRRVHDLAARFGIAPFLHRLAGSLSGGEAQRLSLAKALIRQPQLMLLDEPFSHLDATLQREAQSFVFDELRNAGVTSVLVTHNHQEAQQAGGPVFFMDEGRIVQSGSWESLFRRPATSRIARVVSFLEPLRLDGFLKSEGAALVFQSENPPVEIPVAADLYPKTPLAGQECSLFFRTEALRADCPDNSGSASRNCISGVVSRSFLYGNAFYCSLEDNRGLRFQAGVHDERRPRDGDLLHVPLTPSQQLLLIPGGASS
jgi:ABC-type sugar transport system ATPase subunit